MPAASPYASLFATPQATDPFAGIDFTGGSNLTNLSSTPIGTGLTDFPMASTQSIPDLSGGSGGGGGGGVDPNTAALVKGLTPLLLSLFGNNSYKAQTTATADQIARSGTQLGATGAFAAGQGNKALGPVMQYLMAIAGGNPGLLLGATQPDRARVMDQYDSARKALTFTPRGGGQATAAGAMENRQATDLATLLSEARTKGVSDLGALGKDLLSTGVQAEHAGAADLANAAQVYQGQSQQQGQSMAALGSAVGAALPFILMAL